MAAKTFRLANAAVNGFGRLLESDQTAATTATGWTVGKTAAANDSDMIWGTERAANTFSTEAGTPKPPVLAATNALRSDTQITGEFANANWSIVIAFRSVTVAYSGTIRARARVFRSVNADGSGATEITGSTQVGTTTGAGSTSADTTSTITWAPGAAFTLNGEYLFIVLACEIVTASGSNTADALLRTGTTTTGVRIVTSNMATLDIGTISLVFTPSGIDTQTFLYTDSDTGILGLVPSATEQSTTSDSATTSLLLTPSVVEAAEFIDAATQTLVLTPDGTDVYTPGAAGTEYTDADTGLLVFTPSGTDVADFSDNATKYFALTPSSTDITELTDSATKYLQFSFLPSLSFPIAANNVTDNFNRADESPIGPPWDTTNWVTDELAIVSNKMSSVDRGFSTFDGGADWGTLVSDFEAIITIVTNLTSNGDDVTLEINNYYAGPPQIIAGVELINNQAVLNRTFGGVSGQVASLSVTSAAGDQIGLRRMGNVVEAWYKSVSGSWQLIGSLNQAMPSAMSLDLYLLGANNNITVDDFKLATLSLENIQTVEAGQVYLALTPSGTDVADFSDSATESLVLTPSSVEIGQFADIDTMSLKLRPQLGYLIDHFDSSVLGTDWRPHFEGGLVEDTGSRMRLNFTPPWGFARVFTTDSYDKSGISLTLDPVTIDTTTDFAGINTYFEDDAGNYIQFEKGWSATDVDYFIYAEFFINGIFDSGQLNHTAPISMRLRESANTFYVEYTLDGITWNLLLSTDSTNFLDIGSVRIQANGTPGNYAEIDNFILYTQDVWETTQFTDAAIGQILFTPSGSEIREISDAATESLALTPSDTQVFEGTDQATATVVFTPAGVDIREHSDSATQGLILTASGVEIAEYVDANIGLVVFTPNGVDQFTGVTAYTDSGTGILGLVPNATDVIEYADTGINTLVLSVSGTEYRTVEYIDSGERYLTLTPSGTDTITKEYADEDTAISTLTPSSVDVVEYVDLDTGLLILTPFSSDLGPGGVSDDAEALIKFTPSTYEFRIITQLIGKLGEMRYDGTVVFQRYWSRARESL
jgi:hypothetical protein